MAKPAVVSGRVAAWRVVCGRDGNRSICCSRRFSHYGYKMIYRGTGCLREHAYAPCSRSYVRCTRMCGLGNSSCSFVEIDTRSAYIERASDFGLHADNCTIPSTDVPWSRDRFLEHGKVFRIFDVICFIDVVVSTWAITRYTASSLFCYETFASAMIQKSRAWLAARLSVEYI